MTIQEKINAILMGLIISTLITCIFQANIIRDKALKDLENIEYMLNIIKEIQ